MSGRLHLIAALALEGALSASPAQAEMAWGTFTSNGAVNRAIHCTSFQSDLVII